MLPIQQTIQFSDYIELYDLIIPRDNLLRRINDLVDFFLYRKNSWTGTATTMAVWQKVR